MAKEKNKEFQKKGPPFEPDKDVPAKPDENPDPTKPVNNGEEEPGKKNDPTRKEDPEKTDPTRIKPPQKKQDKPENKKNGTQSTN